MRPSRRSGISTASSRSVQEMPVPRATEPPNGLADMPSELTAIICSDFTDREVVRLTQVSKGVQSSLLDVVGQRIRRNAGQDIVQNAKAEMALLAAFSPTQRLERWDAMKAKTGVMFQPSKKDPANVHLYKQIRLLPQEHREARFNSALLEAEKMIGYAQFEQLAALIDTIPELPEGSCRGGMKDVLRISKDMQTSYQQAIHAKLVANISALPPEARIWAMTSIVEAERRYAADWMIGRLAPLLEEHIPQLPPDDVCEGLQLIGSMLQEASNLGRRTPEILKHVIKKMPDYPAAHRPVIADLVRTRAGHLHGERRAEVKDLLDSRLAAMGHGGWLQAIGDWWRADRRD